MRSLFGRLAIAAVATLVFASIGAAQPKHISMKVIKEFNAGLPKPPKGLDRSTPHRSWSTMLHYCATENWELAAHILNLGDTPRAQQRAVGAASARKLCVLLKKTNQLSANGVNDTTIGPLVEDTPANYVVVATFKLPGGERQQVWVRRFKLEEGEKELWAVTRKSVSLIKDWYRFLVNTGGKKTVRVAVINPGIGPLPARYGLESPRDTATLFRKLTKAGDYQNAARLLDLRGIEPGDQQRRGERLARRLALLFERIRPGSFASLSNDAPGATEKDVPDDEEVIAKAKVDTVDAELRLSRIFRKKGDAVWVFSASTVDGIDTLYDKIGYGWPGDYLPPVFFRLQFAGVQLWQGIGLIAGLVAALIFGYLFGFLTRRMLLRLAKMTKWEWDDEVVGAARGPLILIYFSLGLLVVAGFLALAAGPQLVLLRLCKLLAILGVGWFFIRATDVAGTILHQFFLDRNDEMGMAMVPVARKIFKPIMVLIVGILALQNAGMNVAGLLAGLGIGGLALAMASKSTVENMLGGITIAFDRPFKVGDFIAVDGVSGSVEEVGLRSTRLRTLDRTVVAIPNGKIVDTRIENYSKRDRIRHVFTIGVQYDSTLDQIKLIIDEIKRILVGHDRIFQDGFRVRFGGFGDSALNIEAFFFVDTVDYNLFTAVKEEIFLEIAEVVAAAGAEFAYPSRTIYNGKAAEADSKKAKAARALIEERIKAGEFTIPEIPDSLREKLQQDNA